MSITLITPVWNNAETVTDCIHSINRQTLKCQHIIVDGGSTDGTLAIIEQHRARDAIVVSGPDEGMYDAINKGLRIATEEIVGVLNSDDSYANDEILAKVSTAFADPSIDACYGDLLYVERDNTKKVVRNWKSGEYNRKKFYNGWMPPHPTFFVRRKLYEEYGGYRLDMGSAADYELMLRMLLKHKLRTTYIPEVLVRMRNDGMSNTSLKNRLKANRKDKQAWHVNQLQPKPWTIIAKPVRKLGQWLH